MKKSVWGLVLVMALMGCATTRFVPAETVRTEYETKEVHDSVFVELVRNDSIVICQKGDTVYRDRWHTEYRDRWRERLTTDTVVKSDTIAKVSLVEKPLTRTQKALQHLGAFFLVFAVIFVCIRIHKTPL